MENQFSEEIINNSIDSSSENINITKKGKEPSTSDSEISEIINPFSPNDTSNESSNENKNISNNLSFNETLNNPHDQNSPPSSLPSPFDFTNLN